MATKLYVGNLAYTTTEDELREKFSQFGEVESVNVIMDRDTGRSKGFGFVEMGSEDAAQAAIEAMNGTEIDGRTIKVSESKPQERRPGGGGRGGGRGGFGGGGGRGSGGGRCRY